MTRPAAWIGLIVAASGCGLAGGDASSSPVPSDGVGNFGDASPIEICLGAARVVSPSAASAASAACVEAGTAGRACVADAGCAGIERCVCGRCVVEACKGGASCGFGRVCRSRRCTTACAVDADCAKGERCATGGCARICASDAGCHFGERCDPLDDVCATKLCGGVISCGAGDACDAQQVIGELHEPEIASMDGEDIAFVEIRTAGADQGSAIYRARISEAGRYTIDPLEPVLAADVEGRVGAPSVLVRDGKVELYFAAGDGASIRRAISSDGGRSFARDPNPLLVPAKAWERVWVGSPAVVLRGEDTLLFYEGGPRRGIGVARIHASTADRVGDGPVVAPADVEDPLLWRSISEVGAPYALIAGDAVRLYFTARGAEAGDALVGDVMVPAERNDSIGLFTTRDLASFAPSPGGPIFARTANLRAYLGEREALVRLLPSGAEIIFVAADASGKEVTGLSRAAH